MSPLVTAAQTVHTLTVARTRANITHRVVRVRKVISSQGHGGETGPRAILGILFAHLPEHLSASSAPVIPLTRYLPRPALATQLM